MRVIDPKQVEPTVNLNSREHRDGRQVHRRILSRLRGGPASIDVGFNRSAAGLDYATPYAYNRDEFCYTAAGSARMESGGETVDFTAGLFMWRPAGAATQRFTVTSAYNSICAFAPARTDPWGHLLPQSEAGPTRPRPRFRDPAEIKPIGGTGAGLTHRLVFETPRMQFSHIAIESGRRAPLSERGRDQVYFVESGTCLVSQGAETLRVEQGQFLVLNAAEDFDDLLAESGCILIRWSALGGARS